MPNPREAGGGKVVELCDGVRVVEALARKNSVSHAGRTALRFFEDCDRLSYVNWSKRKDGKGLRDDIIHIGWWQPSGQDYDDASIWARSPRARPASFMNCAQKLIDFMGIKQPDFVHLMRCPDEDLLKYHQDLFNGKRGIMKLLGGQVTSIGHPSSNLAELKLCLTPGDAYEMTFTDEEETSLWHEVEHFVGPNVSMFITAYPEDYLEAA